MEYCVGVTFEQVVWSFSAEAGRAGTPLRQQLGFMSKFSDHKDFIRKTIEITLETLKKPDGYGDALDKVPADMKFETGEKAQSVLRRDTLALHRSFDLVHTLIIVLKQEIEAQIRINSPNVINNKFDKSYQNREKNNVNKKLVKQVENDVDTMRSAYDTAQTKIKEGITAVNETQSVFNENIIKIDSLLGKLCKSTKPKEAKEIVGELLKIVGKAVKRKKRLAEQLEKLRDVVKDYNKQRTAWAELLIGMRTKLISDPKKVTLEMGVRAKEFVKNLKSSGGKKKVHMGD